MDLNLNIHNTFEILRSSYKYIDFRSAMYYKNRSWHRILSIFRFSNETKPMIEKKYVNLGLKEFSTAIFKIQHKILEVSDWENELIELYGELHDEIEIYDANEYLYNSTKRHEYESSFLDEFKSYFSTPSLRFFFTEEEIKNNNLINFHYSVSNKNDHHRQFHDLLNNAIRNMGEENIYDVINRTMQLDGYNNQNGLYISILFPIYIKIIDLDYINEILSGKVVFHKIFENSKLFFRIYSNPNYDEGSYQGGDIIVISRNLPNTQKLENDYFEIKINLIFKKYDCDPNFKIRAKWPSLPNYLINFQKSFGSPRFQKFYNDLTSEQEENYVNSEIPNLKYHLIIDPKIPLEDDYLEVVNEINKAYEQGFFNCVYILIRKLLENLLIDSLRKYYTMSNIDKFFNQDRNKFLPFSKLRLNFNAMIKEPNFKASVGEVPQQVIEYLELFKEIGNSSAHSFFSINHQEIIESNKEKLTIILRQLSKIYKK